MKVLPFKVSAKTARLIGRENVSKAEGAIAELVKNAYDADATFCVVAFLFSKSSESKKPVGNLWIIDNGTGMSADVIENDWMVIGTTFKEENPKSFGGRVRTGAKGIGRFALDRLGSRSTLYSASKNEKSKKLETAQWQVNWDLFEKPGTILDEVTAELETNEKSLPKILKDAYLPNKIMDKLNHIETGTAINVRKLRDKWTESEMRKIEEFLQTLIPPQGQQPLEIYLVDNRRDDPVVEIETDILDDFDYQVKAKVSKDGSAEIELYRNEVQHEKLPDSLFQREGMKFEQFKKSALIKQPYKFTLELKENSNYIAGGFEFTFAFYKKTRSSRAEKFYYRDYDPAPRKTWLNEMGGIKIYRDDFLVRPYGDIKSTSFDWLNLGARKAQNPAAPSRVSWKVGPDNIAGTVHISREGNPHLTDQANREGIISNEAFEQFEERLLAIIEFFEKDRSHILSNLSELYKEENQSAEANEKSPQIAKKAIRSPESVTDEETKILAHGYEHQEGIIEELLDEQIVLRNLATLGSILISFAHDMGAKKNTLTDRYEHIGVAFDHLEEKGILKNADLHSVRSAFNPKKLVKQWEESDRLAQGWFDFVLKSISGSRTRRKHINLQGILQEIDNIWQNNLAIKSIEMAIESEPEEILVTTHEFNLRCVFNNLIINSLEAFEQDKKSSRPRKISIQANQNDTDVDIIYYDNGPGLPADVSDPSKILNFAYTTKGKGGKIYNPVGTGLGMWIVDRAVKSMNGKIKVDSPKKGFRVTISIPIKHGG